MYYEFIISFILAFIVSFSSTPIARKIAFRIGAIDVPKDDRRMHKRPIARLGGLAIVVGFFISFLFSISDSQSLIKFGLFDKQILFFVGGLLVIAITGIIDDAKGIKPVYKLLLQILAASLVVFGADTRVISLTNPFSPSGVYDFNLYVSFFVSILWIVGITNAVNLIDGLDGLAAGVSAISCISLFFIALINNDSFSAILTVILAGSALGFLPYNFNPARIFMGDTGALFLGFTLSVISIQGTLKSYAAISILIPVMALGLPLFDTTFAIIRRIVKGKPIMQADRGHLHHRLIDMGLSHKQSVLVLYTASASVGLSAFVFAERGIQTALLMFVCVIIFVIAGAHYMSEFSEDLSYCLPINEQDEPVNLFVEKGDKAIQMVENIEKIDVVRNKFIK
jgi:UDP-GlcNAc:undecaprenyl-phosphate GlcNAc-1-phosphate transferase